MNYVLKTEIIGSEPNQTEIVSAYTPQGDYVGDRKRAECLYRLGIAPEKANPYHRVCSIGFCKREQKWYGWSHRAICGFGIGHVVQEGDCAASSGFTDEYLAHNGDPLPMPVGFECKTLDDCRRCAIAFASSVG